MLVNEIHYFQEALKEADEAIDMLQSENAELQKKVHV